MTKNKLSAVSLERWLADYSKDTWERLEFCHKFKNVKTYETTLTQNLIYRIWKTYELTENPILRLLEARDEATNGNDIELFVQYGNRYVFFPTQAKSLYPSGRYEQINHKVGAHFQIELLRNFARKKEGIPLYLLYNTYDWKSLDDLEKQIKFHYSLYGCSLVNADYLWSNYAQSKVLRSREIGWTIPKFLDLHPNHAIPLHWLANFVKGKQHPAKSKIFQGTKKARFYSKEEIFDEQQWKDLTPPPSIGRTSERVQQFTSNLKNELPEFRPKFRVVLSDGNNGATLWKIG